MAGAGSEGFRFAKLSARRVWNSFWFVPGLYVLGALALAVGLARWAEA